MGDPKFPRRSYDTPSHPWEGERIKEEHGLCREFGLKNKKELWKAKTILSNYRKQSRDLQARLRTGESQAQVERDNLLKSCARLGLLPAEGATLDDVLTLNTETLLGRRLQTIVYRKGLAASPNQARQLISHGHVSLSGRKVTIPSMLLERGQEENITYNVSSPYSSDLHPLRTEMPKVLEARVRNEAKRDRREKEMETTRGGRGKRGGRGGGGRGMPRRVVQTVAKVNEISDKDAGASAPIETVVPEAPKEE
ncbi:MAG: 30S ribosomal protein S4 [Methanomassiliicoccales archaeon]|jgi:small subunit ribosomal protein S4